MAASMTSFAGVSFRVLRLGQGAAIVNSWEQQAISSEEHVPGSNNTDLFLMGLGPKTATWRIETSSIDDYRALEALQQTSGTLRLPTGTSTEAATEVDYFGTIWDEIPDVTLMQLARPVVHMGGKVQADATFWRASS